MSYLGVYHETADPKRLAAPESFSLMRKVTRRKRNVDSLRPEGRESWSTLEEVGTRDVRGSAHCLSLRDGSGGGGASAFGRSLRRCAHESPAHVRRTQTRTRQEATTHTHHDGTTEIHVHFHVVPFLRMYECNENYVYQKRFSRYARTLRQSEGKSCATQQPQ